MPRHNRLRPPRAAAACLVLAMLIPLGGPIDGARAEPDDELRDAIEQVEALQGAAEAAYQRYRDALSRAELARGRGDAAAAAVAVQRESVGLARQELGRTARAMYASAGVDQALHLLLAPDGTSFGRGLQDLQRVADATAADLAARQRTESALTASLTELQQQRTAAEAFLHQAASARTEADERLAAAARLEERLQREHAADLAARRAAEQSAQLAAARAAQVALAARPAAGATTAGDARSSVVSWALDRVGTPYVLGAEGPQAYDCSSFVTAAYAQVGVGVESYTRAQAAAVTPIPLAAARPGDLLFYFGRGAQHVAIYLGGGRMVHAVNPSRGVAINDIDDSWYRERFTMAGRLLP